MIIKTLNFGTAVGGDQITRTNIQNMERDLIFVPAYKSFQPALQCDIGINIQIKI